ncbi:MAG: flippase-like domain-containing protein [Deltaproteobacteria bacterium]|nr:flippase-like domain-containing protein [Deltaproteobacteria bacterium]
MSETPPDPGPRGTSEAPTERHLVSHVFNIVVFVVAGAALIELVHAGGIENARRVWWQLGPWLGVIIGLDLAAMACDAGAIHSFMRPESRMVSYWRVLAAQASGRAINVLTPSGALGEATKVSMLVGHAPRTRIVAAIVEYNLATLYLSVAILVIGVPITAALIDLPHTIAMIAWVGLAVVIALVIGLVLVFRHGAGATLLAAARRVDLVSAARAQAWAAKVAEVDARLRDLHANRSPGTARGVMLLVVSRVLSWTATTVVLVAVGVAIGPTVLVGLFSVGILVGWVSSVVPLGVGVADAGNYVLFSVLGASAAQGLMVTMAGRVRSLIVALIGLCVMAAAHTHTRFVLHRRRLRRSDPARYLG